MNQRKRQLLSKKQIKELAKNKQLRAGVVKNSFLLFIQIYFSGNFENKLAPFHDDMIDLAEQTNKLNCIMAFRGSGKTTILNGANILWSILGKKNKKFVLIVSKSITQAKLFLDEIRNELETNYILRNDFNLNEGNCICSKTEIRLFDSVVKIASIKSSLRGYKKGGIRPDLIVCDDLEDSDSAKSKILRDKLYLWFKKEIFPLGNLNTEIFILGNYLHYKSLLNTLITEIKDKEINGVYKRYPIVNKSGTPLWENKYNLDNIEYLKNNILDEEVWYTEYLLQGLPNPLNDIKEEDFKYFTKIPEDVKGMKSGGVYLSYNTGNRNKDKSLAIKTIIFGKNYNAKIYIYNNFVYDRCDKEELIKHFNNLKQDIITKRKWIYINKEIFPKELAERLIEDNYKEGILPCKLEYNVFEKYKEPSYDEKFQSLRQIIKDGRLYFEEGNDFIVKEILNFGLDGTISEFMKIFLDFINVINRASVDLHNLYFPSFPPSNFIFCPISRQQYYYNFETEDFYNMKWNGKIVNAEYVLNRYEAYVRDYLNH